LGLCANMCCAPYGAVHQEMTANRCCPTEGLCIRGAACSNVIFSERKFVCSARESERGKPNQRACTPMHPLAGTHMLRWDLMHAFAGAQLLAVFGGKHIFDTHLLTHARIGGIWCHPLAAQAAGSWLSRQHRCVKVHACVHVSACVCMHACMCVCVRAHVRVDACVQVC